MTRLLRFSFIAALLMIANMSFAQTTVTFDATTDKSSSSSAGDNLSITKDGVTILVSNGILGNGSQYRIYKGKKLTVSATSGNITSIVFTCTANGTSQYGPGCFTVADGTYTFESKTGTWTGSAASVAFTASTNQVRATKIVVTVADADPDAVAAPTISGITDFEETTTVTLTAAEGTSVYYTTDGTDPTTASTAYSAPFTLDASATVKAIAVKDGKSSTVAEKSFTKIVYTEATIASLNALTADKNYVLLTLTDAKVVYVNGSSIFVREGDKALLFYYTGLSSLTLNATVSGTVKVNYVYFNNAIPEVKANDFTTADNLTITTSTSTDLDAVETTVADILAGKHVADLVLLKNVSVTSAVSGSYTNYYANSGDDKVQLFGNNTLSSTLVGSTADIYAVVHTAYQNAIEIMPVKTENVVSGIATITTTDTTDGKVYTVSGVLVNSDSKLPSGIYIKNGKKIVVK